MALSQIFSQLPALSVLASFECVDSDNVRGVPFNSAALIKHRDSSPYSRSMVDNYLCKRLCVSVKGNLYTLLSLMVINVEYNLKSKGDVYCFEMT